VNSYQDLLGDGRLVNVSDLATHAAQSGYGQAGLMASSEDFASFLEALLDGSLLGPAFLAAMQERVYCDCYGLGLSFIETPYGLGVGHDGGDVGTRTEVRHFSASDATIVLLANGGDAGVPEEVFRRLWDAAIEIALGS
jgi:D-alanyl-D-alanine carboxypeptidase